MVNSDQLIVAGYVLVAPTLRPPGREYAVLPATFLTISDCLVSDLPRPEFWDWYIDRHEAEHVRTTSAPCAETVTVAMEPKDAIEFMLIHGGVEQPYFDLLRERSRLPGDASVLGYELVGADGVLDFHSWHCHGYAAEVVDGLRVELNEFGLIGTYDQAARVLRWMLSQPPENQPEPVEWIIVALARS